MSFHLEGNFPRMPVRSINQHSYNPPYGVGNFTIGYYEDTINLNRTSLVEKPTLRPS